MLSIIYTDWIWSYLKVVEFILCVDKLTRYIEYEIENSRGMEMQLIKGLTLVKFYNSEAYCGASHFKSEDKKSSVKIELQCELRYSLNAEVRVWYS